MASNRKSFYLYRRSNSIFYARLIDFETGKTLTARSTGQTDRDMAAAVAASWRINGLPASKTKPAQNVRTISTIGQIVDAVQNLDLCSADADKILSVLKSRGLLEKVRKAEDRDFIEFLLEFYNFEKSPYVREKLAHGQSIGRGHCANAEGRIRTHWRPVFGHKKLSEITRQDLKLFALSLVDKGQAPASINKTMNVGKVALKWAFREGLIVTNPVDGLTQFSGQPTKRGILTDEETEQIFKVQWKDKRACIANLVASTTGLRAGEVLALRVEDIGSDRLFVRHSYSPSDGLKSPKNGESRLAPLLQHIKAALLELLEENPHNDGFIFYSALKDQPMVQNLLMDGLKDALAKIGVTETARVQRNLVFHSWRHRYATKMADHVDQRSLKLSTGHKSSTMLEHYANHANEDHFKVVLEAAEKLFQS